MYLPYIDHAWLCHRMPTPSFAIDWPRMVCHTITPPRTTMTTHVEQKLGLAQDTQTHKHHGMLIVDCWLLIPCVHCLFVLFCFCDLIVMGASSCNAESPNEHTNIMVWSSPLLIDCCVHLFVFVYLVLFLWFGCNGGLFVVKQRALTNTQTSWHLVISLLIVDLLCSFDLLVFLLLWCDFVDCFTMG